jgi:serine/threonine protein kinase
VEGGQRAGGDPRVTPAKDGAPPAPDESARAAGSPAQRSATPSARAAPATAAALNDLVAQCIDGLESRGDAAIEAVAAEHPQHAAALRAHIARLRDVGLLAPASGAAGGDVAAVPERLGEFRLLARLGAGGMGVVYAAEQSSLGRTVALKLVRPEHLYFPGARERFRREVEAVARLAHPGIVPVFAGGEDNGIPYYAMERVRGASLEELIAALAGRDPSRLSGAQLRRAVEQLTRRRETASAEAGAPGASAGSHTGSSHSGSDELFAGTWASACLRIARAVALALQHAHEQGVLHRDIKPSNIMLTPDGRVLLLDFGLAAAEGTERLTGTGAPLGSLAWMSPEQVRGDHAALDARTDIYSLGATLHELLTLRSPFTGGDVEATRQRILEGRLIPLRDLNAAVPRDAETVCQRAMDVERERRYADAAAFAEDLDNALALRPVNARRPDVFLKLRRWAQRHPAATIGACSALLLCVGGPLAYAWQQRQAKLQITAAYDEAAAQRTRAEANFARAQKAVDVLLTQVAEEDLLDVPNLEPVRKRLLESALAFYEELLAERTDDAAMKRLVAKATDRCGYLLVQLGRNADACAVYERQSALASELAAQAPDDDELLNLWGDAEAGRGFALHELGRIDEAEAANAEGLRIRRERVATHPGDWSAMRDVDESLGQRSVLAHDAGKFDAAMSADREAVAWNETILASVDSDEHQLAALASLVTAMSNQALHFKDAGRADEALAVINHAMELTAPRLSQLASDPQEAIGAASIRILLVDTENPARTEARIREAIEVLQLALQLSPHHVVLRRMLATACNNLGTVLLADPERQAEARDLLERSIDGLRRLVKDAPGVPVQVAQLGGSLVNLGSIEREAGDLVGADGRFREAMQLAEGSLKQLPDDESVQSTAFNAGWYLGLTCLQQDDPDGCAHAAEDLVRLLPHVAKPLRIAAGLYARAAGAVAPKVAESAPGADAASADAQTRAASWRALGLDALRLAVVAGWSNADNLDTAKDLDELRAFPEFADLRARAEANRVVQP